jgi:hypothetical protein
LGQLFLWNVQPFQQLIQASCYDPDTRHFRIALSELVVLLCNLLNRWRHHVDLFGWVQLRYGDFIGRATEE